ncbi:amino acid adenylation domain-containing protein [Teredinibacter sp. KSP-S5-2]|uniref:amino acid adenylation domain-containing protein n=1 Tax=Teredinibacter sp. KSP-S5-2 TaxID=3034506 RepID=UPI002934D057|nr:amino acid adenylation domain-containing protein [Teredinibacter sp. KSP-S5-2]WNO10697.1 amino acid adenylation domain-containing protein [Teredinibacter sp. KSP-S5-2]
MQTLGYRVLHWAKVQPTALAVDDGTTSFTYQELSTRAQNYANKLTSLGIGTGDRVIILLPKSTEAVSAILGTLLVGATYIPVDTGSPRKRLHNIVDDSEAKAVIVNQQTGGWFDEIEEVYAEQLPLTPTPFSLTDSFDHNQDAYVLYTSGSTGVPNGVRISYHAMHHFFAAVNCHMGISRHSRCMNTSALYFDVSIADLMLPLYQGASVWLGPNIPLPFRFIDIISKQRITHFCAVGSTLTMLSNLPGFDQHNWDHIRCIMTGAEVLNPSTIATWLNNCPSAHVINGYGPTEATCVCTVYEIHHDNVDQHTSFPIGIPLPDIEIYLDPHEATDGTGELCVTGPQIMNGYLNRPLLNRERLFEKDGKPFYRTGDKVSYDTTGNLLFIGRIDDQVKVNGYRIHLGEVAEPFRSANGVQEAIALSLKHPRLGECLAVVVQPGTDMAPLEQLKNECNESLPGYMRPALIAQMSSLPLSASGKVNVKKVRAMATEHLIHMEEEASIIEFETEGAVA